MNTSGWGVRRLSFKRDEGDDIFVVLGKSVSLLVLLVFFRFFPNKTFLECSKVFLSSLRVVANFSECANTTYVVILVQNLDIELKVDFPFNIQLSLVLWDNL